LPDTVDSAEAAPDEDAAIEGEEDASESFADTDAEDVAA